MASERFAEWRFVESTGSTNADLLKSAHAGDWSTTVLVTDHQTSGRGRLERTWEDTAASSLLMSLLVSRDDVSALLPLALGLAALGAVRGRGGKECGLKWPNDLLVGDHKLAGILVETVIEGGVVVGAVAGIGMNLRSAPPGGISLQATLSRAAAGPAQIDRDGVAEDLAANFGRWLDVLGGDVNSGGPALLLEAYEAACLTIGREVRVDMVDGSQVEGQATGIDQRGQLLVVTDSEKLVIRAGDVHHLLPGSYS